MCVCIFVFVYFLSFRVYFVYLYSYLRRICVFPAFTCCRSPLLLTSRHLPVNAGALRWELAAPFINRLQPAERYFRACLRILTPFFCISATNARQKLYLFPRHFSFWSWRSSNITSPLSQVLWADQQESLCLDWHHCRREKYDLGDTCMDWARIPILSSRCVRSKAKQIPRQKIVEQPPCHVV